MQGYRPPPGDCAPTLWPGATAQRRQLRRARGPRSWLSGSKKLTVSSSFLASLASSPEVPLFDANSTEFLIHW